MSRHVQKYCEECKCCHARKNPSRRRRHELGRRPAIWAPFRRLSCDYVAVCKSDRGYDSMLLFTDALTQWVEAFPTQGETAENAATLLYDQIICRYGCPKEPLPDNGSHFANKMVEKLSRVMGVRKSYTVPYRPQASGKSKSDIPQYAGDVRRRARGHGVVAAIRPLAFSRDDGAIPL
jgi:hypothetical protein